MNDITPITKRRMEKIVHIGQNQPEKQDVTYQHKVLAQTCLPYRNPGDDVTKWVRKGVHTALAIQAVGVFNPKKTELVNLGLPYGPKARLLMIYMNEQAVLQQSPVIDVEDNMTAFLTEVHGKKPNGTQLKQYKNQMARLAACDFSISVFNEEYMVSEGGRIVRKFDLWFPKDGNQKVLWSSRIQLSEEYYESLKKYLVPLNRHAVGSLSNNAMALDIYAWLAQRLHWIPEREEQFVSWQNLKEQFGTGLKRMDHFKEKFRETLDMVLLHYPGARRRIWEDKNRGYFIKRAAPPVPHRKSRKVIEGK